MHLPKSAVGDLLAELQAQELAAQQAQHEQRLQQVGLLSLYSCISSLGFGVPCLVQFLE